jgi:hypothetical protein
MIVSSAVAIGTSIPRIKKGCTISEYDIQLLLFVFAIYDRPLRGAYDVTVTGMNRPSEI